MYPKVGYADFLVYDIMILRHTKMDFTPWFMER